MIDFIVHCIWYQCLSDISIFMIVFGPLLVFVVGQIFLTLVYCM